MKPVPSSWFDRTLVARVHKQARADRWGLSLDAFEAALETSVRKAFETTPGPRELETYFESLHLEDLALACACAEGSDSAWEHVIREYRPGLYRAADAIDPSGGSRDLADSLYAELFGLSERDGTRRSHFRYFHGRSSLATWLRAVLAQRHVDRVRGRRSLDPLPDDESPAALPAKPIPMNPSRARYLGVMRLAIAGAVAALAPRDRLRLTCYYSQDLTLAQIGRVLKEHEATVSRHLTRTRREIGTAVEHELATRERMSPAEVTECFSSVLEDPGALDVADMLGADLSSADLSSADLLSADRLGTDTAPARPRKEFGQVRSTDKEPSRAGRR